MELTLSKQEVGAIILEWATNKFPGQFNNCEIGDRYSSYGSPFVKLTKKEPEKAE